MTAKDYVVIPKKCLINIISRCEDWQRTHPNALSETPDSWNHSEGQIAACKEFLDQSKRLLPIIEDAFGKAYGIGWDQREKPKSGYVKLLEDYLNKDI